MKQAVDPEVVNEQECDAIIDRLQRDALSEQDKEVITKVIRSYLCLATMVQEPGVRLRTVRQFLSGKVPKKSKARS